MICSHEVFQVGVAQESSGKLMVLLAKAQRFMECYRGFTSNLFRQVAAILHVGSKVVHQTKMTTTHHPTYISVCVCAIGCSVASILQVRIFRPTPWVAWSVCITTFFRRVMPRMLSCVPRRSLATLGGRGAFFEGGGECQDVAQVPKESSPLSVGGPPLQRRGSCF